ncbi:MAG: TonB-dependent receptor [Acidocella sp.]|nr:TonB-dependent receptor [Acidocella sp.]
MRRGKTSFLLAVAAVMAGGGSQAQGAPQPRVYHLPTVQIRVSPLSATGVDIARWPHPVQVFDARSISAEGAADAVGALSRKATGVNVVNSQANPYQPTILFHGYEISPIQGTPAMLSVYVNGARFNQPFGDLAIWAALPDAAIKSMSLSDGNPVFGLNALGGAVDVRLKDGFTYQGGQAEAEAGSFGKWQGNVQYGRADGGFAAYADFGGTHEAGWRDLQSSDVENFYGDFGWRGAQAALHINATLANSALNGPGSVPVQLLAADPAAQFTGPNRISDKYARWQASLDDKFGTHDTLDAVMYYDYLREQLVNGNGPHDLPCGPGPDAGYLCQGGPGGNLSTMRSGGPIPDFQPVPDAFGYYAYGQLNVNTTNTNGYGGSVQITNDTPLAKWDNRLTAGVSFDGGFTKYDAAGYLGGLNQVTRVYMAPFGVPSPGYLLDEPGTVPVGVVVRNAYYGAYLSDTLNVTKRLAVTASGRFNMAEIGLHSQTPPDLNAQGTGLNGAHDYTHANPALAASYDFSPALTIYGGVSEANAAPTPAELSCASPQDSCSLANFESGDPNLKQIVAHTMEAGLRGGRQIWGGAFVTYDADYYDSVTSDDIEFLQSPYNPVGSGYFANVGNVQRTGFDIGGTVRFTDISVYADYSQIGASYRTQFIEQSNNPAADANGNITVRPGDHLPGISGQIYKCGGDVQITPRWHLGVSATAQGATYLYGDAANLTKPLPGYITADVTSDYQITHNVKVFVTIQNVTDTRYYNYGTFSPTGLQGGVYVGQAPGYNNPRSYSVAAPIGVFVGVRTKF